MRMKILVFTIFCMNLLFAQGGFIPLSVDYAALKGSGEKTILEIYLSFPQNLLRFVPTETNFTGEYAALVEIKSGDSTVFRSLQHKRSYADSLGEIAASHLFANTFSMELPCGSYNVRVVVRDVNSTHFGDYSLNLSLPRFSGDSLMMSELQVASQIALSSVKNEFYKNGYAVIPNPSAKFNARLPAFYYYTEVYNLQLNPGERGEYSVNCFLSDEEGQIVKQYPKKIHQKPGNSAVLVEGHNIITLPAGFYFVNLEVRDLASDRMVRRRKKIFLVKPTPKNSLVSIKKKTVRPNSRTKSYVGFNEQQLDEEFSRAEYLATPAEKNVFKTLSMSGKQAFLETFWEKRDLQKETPVNEFKKSYFERLKLADINFGTMKKRGWQTDRGRVFLVYGKPDEIERNQMVIDKKPFQIWHYSNLEGGVVFVFADLNGFGDYQLLHSTYSREISRPDWERLISRGRQGFNIDERR